MYSSITYYRLGMEFFSLKGDEDSFWHLGKLDSLYSKKKDFQLKNGRFLTG